MPTKWQIIGRGHCGWHAKGLGGWGGDDSPVSGSGGDLEDRSWPARKGQWPCSDQEAGSRRGYASDAVDGALVYDASEADYGAFVTLVISGPMVDLRLPPDGVRRFGQDEREAARRMLPGLEGGFAALAALAQSEKFGGLDYVGIGVYEALLREVPGIKIGRVKNGAVVWEV